MTDLELYCLLKHNNIISVSVTSYLTAHLYLHVTVQCKQHEIKTACKHLAGCLGVMLFATCMSILEC